jgi:hypothetical protein
LSTTQPAAPQSSLANAVDIIIAPSAAFDRIRAVPAWGWALLIGSVLGAIGALLYAPALLHAVDTSMPAKLAASPQMAKLPPEQQQQMIALQMKVSKTILQLFWLFCPIQILIAGLVQGLIMTIANAVGRGDGGFKRYFALSVTVSVIGIGLASLVLGLIVLIRGASSFEEQSAVLGAAPSLALLAPGLKGALLGFLGSFNIFSLWTTALLALGMQRVGRIPAVPAWATAVVMLLVTAAFAAWGAAQNG